MVQHELKFGSWTTGSGGKFGDTHNSLGWDGYDAASSGAKRR